MRLNFWGSTALPMPGNLSEIWRFLPQCVLPLASSKQARFCCLSLSSSRGRHSSSSSPGKDGAGSGWGRWGGEKGGVGRGEVCARGDWGGGGVRGAGPCAADVPSSAGKYRLCCHAGVSLMKIGIR